MGLLEKTRSYLVGGMQYVENGRNWRDKVKEELKDLNIQFFDPYHKPFINDIKEDDETREKLKGMLELEQYDKVSEIFKKVRIYDLKCVDISDFIIAHIDPKVASWGSAEELSWACRLKKATFISIEGSKKCCPYWLFGMFPHKYFYNSVDEIIEIIKKIDKEQIQIDSERWKLLKKEFR